MMLQTNYAMLANLGRARSVTHRASGAGSGVLYPDLYVWFVFLAILDAVCTAVILGLDGREENVLAAWIIHHGGYGAVVIYKFVLVSLVLVICEVLGRQRDALGRFVAGLGVAVTSVPVAVGLIQLMAHSMI
ncbi:MAG: hypothetical protein JNG88_00240 [Phycisphaerales bacterium]|nr:hypothetical protein [Phycisphaerales bacterium]